MIASCAITADYDPPRLLVVVGTAGNAVKPTTVQKFIVVVMPGTHVTTTVQKFIVVVMPGTHVHTTVQIFIVVVSAATAVATTVQKFIVKGREGRKGGKGILVL